MLRAVIGSHEWTAMEFAFVMFACLVLAWNIVELTGDVIAEVKARLRRSRGAKAHVNPDRIQQETEAELARLADRVSGAEPVAAVAGVAPSAVATGVSGVSTAGVDTRNAEDVAFVARLDRASYGVSTSLVSRVAKARVIEMAPWLER